jgi:quinol monooxygenase YgiN
MADEFIIAGWFDYGTNRDAVLEQFAICAAASRDEEGCLGYVASADPAEPGRVVVFERWESEAHLAAHFGTPHIAVFRDAVAGYPRGERDVRRFFISHSEDFQSSSVARA